MLLHRRFIHRCLMLTSISITLLLSAGPFVTGGEPEPAGSEERLRELLTERRDVLKQMLVKAELFVEEGRLDPVELRRATIALHHAEAELCTTRADRVRVYEKLVEAMQTQQDLAVRREAAGRIGQWQLAEARAATLEAKINLERVRLGRQTSR